MVIKKKQSKFAKLKQKSRFYSIKEGIFSWASDSFGNKYVAPFAIAINSSNSMIAMLSAISGLFGPLSQLFGSRLPEKQTRKKILLKTIFFESLTWLPLIFLAILFHLGLLLKTLPFLLLFSYGLFTFLSNLGFPAWFSWMGDIVDKKYRGRWFAKRGVILGFTSSMLTLFAAFFLDYFKNHNWTMLGFGILFLLAFISRFISWIILKKQYEPKIKLKKGYYFSFWNFVKNTPKNNFGKYTIFRAFFSFAQGISASLIAVYFLRNLNFSYTLYMVITLSTTLFSLFVLELWGKFADKYGNYKILCITTILIPMIPILYILSESPLYLIFVPSLIGGVSWAGFNLVARNFVYDNVSVQRRGLVVSYYNLLIGVGTFLGAGLGAFLIKFLTITFMEPIIFIFILGSIIRMVVVFWWVPQIKEVRKTKKLNSRRIKNLIFKEAKPTLIEEAHEIMSIKGYLWKK